MVADASVARFPMMRAGYEGRELSVDELGMRERDHGVSIQPFADA